MATIGRADLGADPDLADNAGRWRRRDELDAAIAEWTSTRRRTEVLAALDAAGVPAGPIYTAADICADEQYRARNMIQYFDVDTGEAEPRTVGFPGIVPVLGEVSLPVRGLGPDLGEHTAEVLTNLLGRCHDDDAAVAADAPP
jgi:formyl-CoA transferase